MKKLLCVMFVAVLLLTGCSKSGNLKNVKAVSQSFSAVVEMEDNSNVFTANITRNDDKTELCFVTPQAINGLTVTKTAENCQVKFLNLEVSTVFNYFPQKSMINVIDGVLDELKDPAKYTAKKQGKKYVYLGTYNSEEFELVRDCETLSIVSIEIKSKSILISFSDYVENS